MFSSKNEHILISKYMGQAQRVRYDWWSTKQLYPINKIARWSFQTARNKIELYEPPTNLWIDIIYQPIYELIK